MKKNGYSTAFREFEKNIMRPKQLMRLEISNFKDPPPPADQLSVEALRGGAVVLMTSSFERYLKDALQEYVILISTRAVTTAHSALPRKFVQNNDFNFINWLTRDSRQEKTAKINEIKRVSSLISADGFIPESFNRTRSNPGPNTVKDLLADFGISDPFRAIEPNFAKHFKTPFAQGYIELALNSIVTRRNEIAHGGTALTISRQDIREWIVFLHAFARAADNTLRDHTLALIATL